MDVFVNGDQGDVVDLGVAQMRLVVPSAATAGQLAVGEFRGGPGPWTVPHVHNDVDESFYVLDGSFRFTCDDRDIEASRGAFVVVPRGTRHVLAAGPDGGALLTMWLPGGLEEMFLELGRLPAGSLTDPSVRREISKRFDSVPV